MAKKLNPLASKGRSLIIMELLDACAFRLCGHRMWMAGQPQHPRADCRIDADFVPPCGFIVTGAQIRAARALLRWSAVDLARASALGVNTVRRAEVADTGTSLTAANELAIRRAFEGAGVEFTNGDQPGVRPAKAAATHSPEPTKASNPTVIAKKARRKTAKATERKRYNTACAPGGRYRRWFESASSSTRQVKCAVTA